MSSFGKLIVIGKVFKYRWEDHPWHRCVGHWHFCCGGCTAQVSQCQSCLHSCTPKLVRPVLIFSPQGGLFLCYQWCLYCLISMPQYLIHQRERLIRIWLRPGVVGEAVHVADHLYSVYGVWIYLHIILMYIWMCTNMYCICYEIGWSPPKYSSNKTWYQ